MPDFVYLLGRVYDDFSSAGFSIRAVCATEESALAEAAKNGWPCVDVFTTMEHVDADEIGQWVIVKMPLVS